MTLEILVSDALGPVSHGFFTRRGGASSGVFEGLNCGLGSSDQTDIVAINRARVADALGVGSDHLVTVHQIHSPDVATLSGPIVGSLPRVDGLVTATPGLAVGVLTADCQPVLFADVRAGVVGAAHAGWKGALAGILEATVDAMEVLGARRSSIAAVIGPSISQRNYEVGPEFFETFRAEDPRKRPLLRQRRRRASALRPARIRPSPAARGGRRGRGMDRALHLCRPRPILFLPAQPASARARLWATDLRNPHLTGRPR